MKKAIKCHIILFSALIFTHCGSMLEVTTDYDKNIDFTNYKTYAFYTFTDKSPGISELNRNRIINSIRNELEAKGFVKDTIEPDFLVNATAILKERKEVTATTNYYDYGGYYRPYYWGPGYETSTTTTYNETTLTNGSLIIDIIDAENRTLIWQSIGNKDIDSPSRDPDEAIGEAVKEIMKGFPPEPQAK